MCISFKTNLLHETLVTNLFNSFLHNKLLCGAVVLCHKYQILIFRRCLCALQLDFQCLYFLSSKRFICSLCQQNRSSAVLCLGIMHFKDILPILTEVTMYKSIICYSLITSHKYIIILLNCNIFLITAIRLIRNRHG